MGAESAIIALSHLPKSSRLEVVKMIIDNFEKIKKDSKVRLSVRMVWEDCDRPKRTLFYEVDEHFSDALSDNANAFLLATAIPAMHFGEKRLRIDTEVCPELTTGIKVALDWLYHWFDKDNPDRLKIDVKFQKKTTPAVKHRRAGVFFSGGIDSYAALCANRRDFVPQHPGYIRDGIVIYGLELDQKKQFERVLRMLSKSAEAFNVTLIPIFTNIYLIYRREDKLNHFYFWKDKFASAALMANAHALDNRIHTVSLGSSFDIPNIVPLASHPAIEPNYTSSLLRVRFDAVNLSRFEKTKLIAQWDDAVQNIRVCNRSYRYKDGQLNCGECDKCVRTALALEALGKLAGNPCFPYDQLPVALVAKAFRNVSDISSRFLLELITPLKMAGKHELAQAVQAQLEHLQRKKGHNIYSKRILKPVTSLIKRNLSKLNEKRSVPVE